MRYPPELALTWVSHEVRRPIVGASAAIERVLQTASLEPDGYALLTRCVNELQRASQTLEGLLALATGSFALQLETVNLVEIAQAAATSAGMADGLERVRIVAPRPVLVEADPTHLHTALTNIVDNALAYSAGAVVMSVRGRGARALIRVTDEGPGIHPEESAAVFEAMRRGVAGENVSGGQGMGLFIAREIVDAHGGTIEVSTGDGGSIMMTLPVITP